MNYPALSALFLLVAIMVAAFALVTAPDRKRLVARWWLPAVLSIVLLLVLTAVFDNLMIAAGFMRYDSAHILGVLVGRVPVEDFAYPVAAVVLLPALWLLLRRRDRDDR